MAINAQKLLPSGRLSTAERMSAAYDKRIDDLLNIQIKTKLINVDKLLKKSTVEKKKKVVVKKKSEENEERAKKEKRLEREKETSKFNLKVPGLPKTGFLDTLQNFLSYTFLGYLIGNYYEYLPRLLNFAKVLGPALKTVESIVVGTFEAGVFLINAGYKARNELSNQINKLGGKDAQKTFDKFTTEFKDLINSIMTLGLYQAKQPVPQQKSGGLVKKMAVGGNITRTGIPISRPTSRAITVVKQKPKARVKPQQTQPGKDVGGKKRIEKLFPDPLDSPTPDTKAINPLRSLKTTSKSLKQIPFLGGIMGAAVDVAMGQKPERGFYRSFGSAIGSLIQNSIDNQTNLTVNDISKTVFAMANGGPISRGITRKKTTGEEIGMQIAKMFEVSLNGRVNQIFNQIIKEMSGTSSTQIPGVFGATGVVSVSSDSPDFWLLAVASLLENSNPQGASDVAQVIYNRVASPSWPNSIKSVIMSGNGAQFQPVRDYGTIAAWNSIKDKESAINFIKTYGKGRTQTQLETVAAALLDPIRQRSANTFVGPRDSFRAISYENKYNHLADDTEQRRHGHAFGFEPGGAQIGAFRAGKLKPAAISPLVKGTVTQYSSPLTGENGRLSPSQLTRVGTLYGKVDYQDWYGNGAYLRHDAAKAFLAAKAQAQKEGINILITSAYRSLAHQQALQGIYSVVATPGTSRHGEGTALDIQTGTRGYEWFVRNGPTYGWRYAAIPGDPVHFEYVGGWRPSNQAKTKKTKSSTSSLSAAAAAPTSGEIAQTTPNVSQRASSIAMTPSYDSGQEVVFVLSEKIVMMDQNSPINFPSQPQSIQTPGLNSRVPTLVG